MTLKTINITFCKFLSIDENLYYKPHPTDSTKTLLQQDATVSVEGIPLSHYMEEVLTNSISSNAGKGRVALEWVIDKINTEVSGAFQVYILFSVYFNYYYYYLIAFLFMIYSCVC